MPTLVVRTDKIGDLVLASSVAEAIKKNYPKEKVFFMCSKYAQAVLENNPYIDFLITISGKEATSELVREIKALNADKALILFAQPKVSLAIFLSGIPERCIGGFKWHQFLHNRVVFLRRSKCLMKEWQYNLKQTQKLFPKIDPYAYPPKVYPDTKIVEEIKKQLAGIKKPLILVYPGGGKEIRWPVENFFKLCSLIEKNIGSPLVVLGPQERELTEIFKKWLFPKELSLRELIALIYLADAVVSNNTGPMHIAAALNKPLVQIFDPRWACNPSRWGHHYPKSAIVRPPVPFCERCTTCCPHYNCMKLINAKDVYRALEQCLKG